MRATPPELGRAELLWIPTLTSWIMIVSFALTSLEQDFNSQRASKYTHRTGYPIMMKGTALVSQGV